MIWWLIGIVVLVVFLRWWMKRPHYHRNVKRNEFERFLRGLIVQSAHGAILFIEHEGSDRFVQFAKYVTIESGTIINFGFPDAPWSQNYFKPLMEALESAGVDYHIQSTGDDHGFVSRFIDVNMKVDNIDKVAKELARIAHISFETMGLGNSEKFQIHYEGDMDRNAVLSSTEELLEEARKKWRTRKPGK